MSFHLKKTNIISEKKTTVLIWATVRYVQHLSAVHSTILWFNDSILRQLKFNLGEKNTDPANIVTDLKFKTFCKILNFWWFLDESLRTALPKTTSYFILIWIHWENLVYVILMTRILNVY